MSSILDALKKLEAEKAARQAVEQEEDLQFHPETAAGELVAPPTQYPSATALHLSPMAMVIGGAMFAVLLIAISVTASIVVARNSVSHTVVSKNSSTAAPPAAVPPAPPSEAALPTPEPVPAAPEPAPAAPPPDTPPPAAAQPPLASPAPALASAAPPPASIAPPVIPETPIPAKTARITVAQAAEPPAEPQNVNPVPPPAPPVQSPPAIVPAVPATTKPPPAVKPAIVRHPPGPVDLESLPILRSSERVRYGLENLRLNVLREAGPNRPSGLAIINLNKVYIGEIIPGTRARLIEVKSHGIGIEIADTGERFYVPH